MAMEAKVIGRVKANFKEDQYQTREFWAAFVSEVIFPVSYANNLKHLFSSFETAFVLFNFHCCRPEDVKMMHIPKGFKTGSPRGVFSVGGPSRPNHMGISECALISLREEDDNVVLTLRGLDALDGSPVMSIIPGKPKTHTENDL